MLEELEHFVRALPELTNEAHALILHSVAGCGIFGRRRFARTVPALARD